jgi:hypothetical protein
MKIMNDFYDIVYFLKMKGIYLRSDTSTY